MKRIAVPRELVLLLVLTPMVLGLVFPVSALAQVTWGSDQLIENNAGDDGYGAEVAMSGSNAVAVWRQGFGSASRIYSNYSSDGGVTWGSDQLIEHNVGYEGWNPQVAMSGSNAVAVWRQMDISHQRIYSNHSSDGGATWGSDQLIENNAGYDGDEPQVAMSGSNVVAVWWQSDGSHQRIYSNHSSDGGATWGSDQLIENNVGYDAQYPQVAMSGSNVVAVWRQWDGSASRIYTNYSSDGGATWGSDQLIENNAGYNGYGPQVAMSGSNVVAVWDQWDGSHQRIYSNHSSDGGATWGSDQLIENSAGDDGWNPQVAMSGFNAVAVWHQWDGSALRIYSNHSSDGGATWGSDQLIEDNAGYDGWNPQVAISGFNAVAVWDQWDGSVFRIYSNHCSDGGVTWDSDQLIEDNAGHNGRNPQVAMTGSNAVAVWWQSDGSHQRIYSNYSAQGSPTGPPPAEVWVDDDWAGSSYGDAVNGHTFGVDAFATIQHGINAVAQDGTVYVYPGKYDENLSIWDKSLTLQSTDGWQLTTIDPIGAMIWIWGEVDVTVQGFEITGGTYGIYVTDVDSTVHIMDCFIHDNSSHGICVEGDGDLLHIEGNIISENGGAGIDMTEAWTTVNIVDNVIGAWLQGYIGFDGNNHHGIHIGEAGETDEVNIEGNAISENGQDGINFGVGVSAIYGDVQIVDNIIGAWTCYRGDYGHTGDPERYGGNDGKGILIYQVGDTGTATIMGNRISENSLTPVTGIHINSIYGVVTIAGNYVGTRRDERGEDYLGNMGQGILVNSVFSEAVLTIGPDNAIKGNSSHGIDILWGSADAGIKIHNNLVHQNGPWVCGTGIKLGSGGVCGAIVSDNIITNNHKGIYLDQNSKQNTIQDNEIRDNGHGIWIEGDDNHVRRNYILNNVEERSGIHLTSTAEGNVLHCNNIDGNLPYGVYNENYEEVVDATRNWWGHASGPSGVGSGSGDAVSTYADYSGWLPAEFQDCPECNGVPPVVPPLGGTAYPVWTVLLAGLVAGASLLVLRRRQAQSQV